MSSASPSDRYLLAIDLGTTSCKVALCDPKGRLMGVQRADIPLIHPRPLWAEADPRGWWETTKRLIRQALRETGVDASQIAGIGLCGLMHALVPVDVGGQPLANSMLWMDQRCRPECDLLRQAHGERIRQLTGGLPRTTTSAPKLFWLKRHEPQIVKRTHRFLLPKDFIRHQLTGDWATDPSDAGGTALLDSERRWARAYLEEILDVPAEKFPPIRPSEQVVGRTTARAAEETGLPPGIPVVTGSSDVKATLLGVNLFVPDRLCLYMGTAAWLARGTDHGGPDLRCEFLGATATFGAAIRWYVQQICAMAPDPASYSLLEEAAQEVPPGSDGLVWLPHLMGERGPYTAPGATGVIFGMTLHHGRAHLFRALLESTACQIRHILEARGIEGARELWCVGGGTHHMLWLHMLADMTHLPVIVPREREAGLLGAAMLAAVGIGMAPSLREIADAWVHPEFTIPTHPQDAYETLYTRYRVLDAHLQPFFEEEKPREVVRDV